MKIILPPVLAVALFIVALFGFLLPSYENSLMEQQRTRLRETTDIAWHLISTAREQVSSGMLSSEEAKSIVLDHLRGTRYGDEDLDYFWVNDMRPVMVMHPYRTDLEGTDVSTFVDPHGKNLFLDMVDIARSGGEGFIRYMWQWKNDPARIEPKLSFVKYFAPWDWIVGTGIYLNDIDEKIAALSRRLILISSAIIILVSLLTYYMTRQALNTARSRMQAKEELDRYHDYLERLVEERTRNLTHSNRQLQAEIAIRRELQDQLFQASITDALTELYNRRGFIQFAEKQIELADRQKTIIYLLYMDLDNMKNINDRFGHEMGDRALRETADILTGFFRKSDIISRLGGDEFAVLMVDPEESLHEEQVVQRFEEHLQAINEQADRPYQLHLSIGAVRYDHRTPCSIDSLLSSGDALMYKQKRKTRLRKTSAD